MATKILITACKLHDETSPTCPYCVVAHNLKIKRKAVAWTFCMGCCSLTPENQVNILEILFDLK